MEENFSSNTEMACKTLSQSASISSWQRAEKCVSASFTSLQCAEVCVCVVCYPLQLITLLVMTHPCQPTPVSLKQTFQTCYLGSSSSSVPFGHICSMCQGSSLQQGTLCLGSAFLTCPVLCVLFLSLSFFPFFLASTWFCTSLA